nr:uncharacterized protein LOC116431732 [Nomia melanderi]
MAPLMQTGYHSAEEPSRYSLRVLKRSEKSVSQADHVDASKINRKEDFLRCLGLQMKTFQCVYIASDGVHDIKARNNTNGLKLRNCSVVILGVTCQICGKCFKCKTDVNVHMALKHGKCSEKKETRFIQGNSEVCQKFSEVSQFQSVTKKNPRTRLRLILRIGDEVVTDISLKRKHLKSKKSINTATQTEPDNVTKLITENSVGESIDHSVFDNSPCQCCTATIRTTSTNQYVAANIVASEESAGRNDSCCMERLTSISEKDNDTTLNSDSFTSDLTNTKGSNLVPQYDREAMCSRQENNCNESCKRKSDSFKSVTDVTKTFVDTVTVTFQSPSTDINGNEKVRDRNEKLSNSSDVINTVKLIMPVILPIIMPSQVSPKSPEDRPLASSQARLPKTGFIDEQNSDDEVQEVLRIVRGHDNIAREINHESPNRLEQEILARDAIRNMLRLEQQGWHLLEKSGNELTKKRKRTGGKFDTKNVVGDETGKKKTKIVGSENNVVKTMNERSSSKESFAKAQKPGHDKMSIAENAKENVLMCNGSINIPTETLLHHYGINYYSDVCEINNNTETTVQEPVSGLLANRPTVIDLVNDTEE